MKYEHVSFELRGKEEKNPGYKEAIAMSSPFFYPSDFFHHWSSASAQREVVNSKYKSLQGGPPCSAFLFLEKNSFVMYKRFLSLYETYFALLQKSKFSR